MRIVCPKCELKGQVDVAPTGAKTRVACVRCATTFDAVVVDGEIQALLPQTIHAGATSDSNGIELYAEGNATATGTELVSTTETPHENPFEAFPEVESSHVIEASPVALDEFSTSSPDLMSEAVVETAQATPQALSQELAPQGVETRIHETASSDRQAAAAAVGQSYKSNGAGKVSRPPADAYGMGVRLMRVSPLWLLLAGLSFISFIVFCNWLIKPAEQAGDTATLIAAANNHATNQSANRVTVQTSTAQSPVNTQVGQTPNDSGVAFIATDAKEAMPPVAAPSVAPVEAKPTVEEKQATATSTASNAASDAKEGKVTIQVGSYNAAAEAEARVANLKSAGFEARSVEVEIPKRGTWYRVQSGRFVSRDEAERYGKQLLDKGIVSSFITTDVQE
ncbi:MAG: DedD protein [Pyrinomonadaceae bacterium]|nr:DedD protein [Pyrinomonadaceae bacterium]